MHANGAEEAQGHGGVEYGGWIRGGDTGGGGACGGQGQQVPWVCAHLLHLVGALIRSVGGAVEQGVAAEHVLAGEHAPGEGALLDSVEADDEVLLVRLEPREADAAHLQRQLGLLHGVEHALEVLGEVVCEVLVLAQLHARRLNCLLHAPTRPVKLPRGHSQNTARARMHVC